MPSITAPTLWFCPPYLATDSPNAAGAQFMNLFSAPSSWPVTASNCAGIVLDENFILTAPAAQLTEIFGYLNDNHLQLAINAQMIPIQSNGVGSDMEGYGTTAELSQVAQRISSLGGTLDRVTMDSPITFGCVATTGAQFSISELAEQIAPSVALVQAVFPEVQFVDQDALCATSDLEQFAQAFQQATGTSIAGFDADVSWGLSTTESNLESYASAVRATGATFGILGDATAAQTSSLSWALTAESNIAGAEANPLINPANVEVVSWNPNPTAILPEGLAGTLSHVAVETSQFAPLYASGYLTGGAGVTVSTVVPTPSYAGSAADAVAGAAVAIPGVQLNTSSASPGMTFAVVITDVSGALGATASGAGQVSGEGTGVLTLTGGLGDINAELASLTYTGVGAGTDTIDVTTYDGVGMVDDHQIAVDIAAPIAVPLPPGVGTAALYQNIFGLAPSEATLAVAQGPIHASQIMAQVAAPWMAQGQATIISLVAAPWVAQGQATITALYEQVEGVTPTTDVLANLTEELLGGESLAQISTSLANSAAVQSELVAVYQDDYGTAPTGAQLAALTQQLASGTSLEALEAPLLANSQAEVEITSLYQQVEGQAPATSDLITDARALLTGTSLATIQNELATSPPVQSNLATLCQRTYEQSPTAAQLASLTAELVGGTSYAQIQVQLTSIVQDEVIGSFQSVLNRNPSAYELSFYTYYLTTGAYSLAQMSDGLAYSAEASADVSAIYQQVVGQAPTQAMVTELEQCLNGGTNPIPLAQLGADIESEATIYQQVTGQTATAAALIPLMNEVLDQTTYNVYMQMGGTMVMAANTTGIRWVGLETSGTSYNFTANATQGLVIAVGADNDTITVGSASQTVIGSSGNLLVLATAANAGVAIRSGTGSNELEITTGGTVTLNSGLAYITVQLDAASTLVLPTNSTITTNGSAGNDVFVITSQVLRAGQHIDGGGGVNTLALQGGGAFNLTAPSVLENFQVVDATEGQSAGTPIIFLRDGLDNLVLNLTSASINPQSSGAVVHGANNNDVINLGLGTDTVYVGSASETINGSGGNDGFCVTNATIGATITGGGGTDYLWAQGGGAMVMGANITGIRGVILVTSGTSYNFTANATQGLVITAGADSDTITVGGASQTVNGSTGNLLVLATAADAGVAIRSGTGSNELEITTGGTVTLNNALNNITVQLDAAATLTLDHMQFIHAVGSGGNDVIIAGAAGQVLTGGGGQDKLEDGGHYGVTFQDTVAGFLGDTLVGFSKVDTIDITNLFSVTASPIYDGTYGASSSGLLAVANGSGFVDINLSGLTAGGSFHGASDNHGGTLITYS